MERTFSVFHLFSTFKVLALRFLASQSSLFRPVEGFETCTITAHNMYAFRETRTSDLCLKTMSAVNSSR